MESQYLKIVSQINQLRNFSQIDGRSLWRYTHIDLPLSEVFADTYTGWQPVEINEKGHVGWAAGKQVIWLKQEIVIPATLKGYPLSGLVLRIALRWWTNFAQIYINGKLVQEGDLFECAARILVSNSVTPGETYAIALRLVSPSHDTGALVHSTYIYEQPNDTNKLEPGFIADELEMVSYSLSKFHPEKLEEFNQLVHQIDWESLPDNIEEFELSLTSIRNYLQSKIQNPKSKIHLLGHSHLDMAWLWDIEETWKAAQRTFTSALNLMQEFPELTFCHSTPALYEWIETHRPDLFTQIKQQVIAGRWEVVGGMWIEPELNIIGGESIVRQLLYGQAYTKDKFGEIATVAWLPDTFGFCWQLPQFLKQAGIEFFVTQKLLWNDTNQFPHEVFWWEAPDGTRIFSLMSAPIGEGIEPPKMSKYAVDWLEKTGLKNPLWLPGVGDRGGGPTRDMLEVARRWQVSPFLSKLEFTTAASYLNAIAQEIGDTAPVWRDELYLEFHRGCYTTHADQKLANRRCEDLLYQAELFASLAALACGQPYPKTELESAWKQILFNQFHDILPGTAIPSVYVDANRDWEQVKQVGSQILQQSLEAIANSIHLPQPPQPNAIPIVVFNPLNWERSELVTLLNKKAQATWKIYDSSGDQIPTQSTGEEFLFLAESIPGVGYKLFWLAEKADGERETGLQGHTYSHYNISTAEKTLKNQTINLPPKIWELENQFVRVTIDSKTGNLASIFDKINRQEVLGSSGGNQLQSFTDEGQYWDAWNIDPNYQQKQLPESKLISIEWRESGELRQSIRVKRLLDNSEFIQDYILTCNSPILKIATQVDWRERHIFVKAAFDFNWSADAVTYEIPCGVISRTTRPQTPEEKAKWEVPAFRWADLTSNNYGVSLLNDSKYGYDAKPGQLRLSLLRGATWPDPQADVGHQEFTYAVYPHLGNWQEAQTVRRGYELNQPILPVILANLTTENQTQNGLPSVGKLLSIPAENLVLVSFKQSETDNRTWVLRCYESHGVATKLTLESDLGISLFEPVDLLERPKTKLSKKPNFPINPWEIATFTIL
ncbi:alpha-mannosidase [Merismopedia glauca]|uniref:Alpha-mannosidase n=1 Tax=Merismopedia glauca CCAP 1448/3 TaxID=1296344 RepID=A0A2T1C8V1_9CYAN|nr:alpha-mannosidase [Merismopedia glauca]PSB04671.1 alpha-mannosidase [Merismopedia glauca CCAP 1448/3]